MFITIDQPDGHEMHSVIQFFTARNVSVTKIHEMIRVLYLFLCGEQQKNAKIGAFKGSWKNVHHESRSCKLVTEDLVNSVNKKNREDR